MQHKHPERRISAATVRDICGGISDMSLWRWLNDPVLGFPKPIKIGNRRYWRESEVLAFLDSREAMLAEAVS
ncbi:helix-turn-helix transcriptional regulator [Rhodobacter capsulatus]|uniref:helix-turn-helix transcriptional regulator n=1 Tax=Rhodobacter capsulatus TaxID=1061 RepID=UPI001F51A4D6|nr:transcriptional regulator [Rhodobacter capsulatus]